MNSFVKVAWLFAALLLLCGIKTYAQQSPPPSGFRLFFEKVYLHTDRDVYLQSDTLWFKAYLVNGQNNRPIDYSKTLYVELINQDSAKVSLRHLIRLNDGVGHGDFTLNDSLPAGNYTLRAYTNWMRNFGDSFVFEKQVTVLGDALPADSILSKSNTRALSKNKSTGGASSIKYTGNTFSIQFFPESGSLVEGVSSVVAVKAQNSSGKGITAIGAILNTTGDTVAHFTCDSLGMGVFALLPLKGQTYRAIPKVNKGKSTTIPLPSVLGQGFAMRVTQTDSLVRATITCNDATRLAYLRQPLSLIGKHGGVICFSQQLSLTGNQIPVKIPASLFPQGIATLTLYQGPGTPHCERLIYIHHAHKSAGIGIKPDKPLYTAREKVTVQIKTGAKSNLSAAVVDAGLVPPKVDDIASYLLLTSELKGNVEHVSSYFDTTNVNRFKQLDLLLLTQGWRDFLWRRMADTAIKVTYAPEQGLSVQGTLYKNETKTPLAATNVGLYASKATGTKLFSTVTDSAGRYVFNNLVQYGNYTITVNARNNKGTDIGQLIPDTTQYKLLPTKLYPKHKGLRSATYAAALLQQKAAKINLKDTVKLKAVKVKGNNNITLRDVTVTSFGYPDEVLIPTPKDNADQTVRDYILFTSKQARYDDDPPGQRHERVIFVADGLKFDPRLIVNGYEVPLEDEEEVVKNDLYNRYFNLRLSKLEKIVIKKMLAPIRFGKEPLRYGYSNNEGSIKQDVVTIPPHPLFIIYLTLKPGALDEVRNNVAIQQVPGYYQTRTFYKPVYDKPSKTTQPDMRTTIHWQPLLQTDATGQASFSFYNADNARKVSVIVQGVTESGVPVSGTSGYKVK